MACVGILFTEMWLFGLASRRGLAEIFDVKVPPLSDFTAFLPERVPSAVLLLVSAIMLGTSFATGGLQEREELVPIRPELNTFPLKVAEWRGSEQAMEQIYLDQLQLDDYVMANFVRPSEQIGIDLYIAYYESQRKGASVHSPKACLPGGGWEIVNFDQKKVDNIGPNGESLNVNRAVVKLGDMRQLVYYWFQQRDRNLTNEYLVKWYIFWDALTRNRTDGALIRLVTLVPESTDIDDADERMQEFLRDIDPTLAYYLPKDLGVTQDAT